MAENPEQQLIERCKAGDPTAFRECYRRHRAGVYSVVARMISNDADRDEVVQDAFLQIFRSLKNFRGTSKLSTWIHRVTVNVTLQYIRKKGRRIKLQYRDSMLEYAGEGEGAVEYSTPESDAITRDRRTAVQRALDDLSPKKRIVLILADFEGLPSKEIATIVKAPTLTVRTRLFYARKEFYDRLGAEPAFDGAGIQDEKREK